MDKFNKQIEIIEMNKMTWQLVDTATIEVTYNGTLDEYYTKVECDLANVDAYAIKYRYDKKANKTTTLYKRVA